MIGSAALLVLVAATTAHAGDECARVPVWRDGRLDGTICRGDAEAAGLVVIDLGDDWVPPVLAPEPDGTGPGYRATYLALAQERFGDAGLDGELARGDRYLELYGIEPAPGVVRERLADDARHRCHDAIDDSVLAGAPPRIGEEPRSVGLARIASARALRAELEHDRVRAKLADLDALAASDRYFARQVARLRALEGYVDAVRAVQAHLACDDLFEAPAVPGAYTWQTSNAVERFQRGTMILPSGVLDDQTREELARSSRERDFATALRVLRARVVAATGLIEDGTAGPGEATVLGRALEPEATWRVRGYDPLDGAAPDLIAPATEAAARALGWKDPATALASLEALARTPVVALPLPPPPAYYSPAMQLEVEIDRGDVWHDPVPRWRDAARRPALILYARVGDRRVPLARWPTTIGGWQNEKTDGDIVKEWKESPVGPRIWRDLLVGPSWLPPDATPDRELVRWTDRGYVLAREQFGPSYRAAFGFVAFVHLRQDERGELDDQGIRTHGTGNLPSLAHGVSHGCHRLLGLHVVRLADFVLAHRDHVARGDQPTYYRRVVRHGGAFPLKIDSLGYRIELEPPIPVEVLAGRIHR
ncbi:MAG TPA: peptidoglycan-binding domain-containing protein [Kofleriaceae bacterium]|nr:peptidoglycan-binding domain-containing protein [Kofleriaceae bacterium]